MQKELSMKEIYLNDDIRLKPYPICPKCGGHIKIIKTDVAFILTCTHCNHTYYCENIYADIEEWNQHCQECKYSPKKIFIFALIIGLIVSFIYGSPYSIFAFGLVWSILSFVDQYKMNAAVNDTIIEALSYIENNTLKKDTPKNTDKIVFNIKRLDCVNNDNIDIINEYNEKINQYCKKHNESIPKSIIKYNTQIASILKILQEENELCNDKIYIDTINETLHKYELLFKNEYTKLVDNTNIHNRAQIKVIQESVNSEYEYLNIFRKDKLNNILNVDSPVLKERMSLILEEWAILNAHIQLMCKPIDEVEIVCDKVQEHLDRLQFYITNIKNDKDIKLLMENIFNLYDLMHSFRVRNKYTTLKALYSDLILPMFTILTKI